MKKSKVQEKKEEKLHAVIIKQLISLSTAGFGLVAALAWNEAIQSFVKEYVDQYLKVGSGTVSRLIYAVFITALAVLITVQLSKLLQKISPNSK